MRQIELAVADKGEHIALLEARKQLCWYLKGVSHANYYKGADRPPDHAGGAVPRVGRRQEGFAMMEEKDLICRAARGDAEAFRQLVEAYQTRPTAWPPVCAGRTARRT